MPSAVYPFRWARPLSELPQAINWVHRFLHSTAAMFCARYKPCLDRQDLEMQKINHCMSQHDATETKVVSFAVHDQETKQMLLLATCLHVQTFSETEKSKPLRPKPALPFSAVRTQHTPSLQSAKQHGTGPRSLPFESLPLQNLARSCLACPYRLAVLLASSIHSPSLLLASWRAGQT